MTFSWQDSNVHQMKLRFSASVWVKNEGTIFKINYRNLWGGHLLSFSQIVTWSLEDACRLFCSEHFIFKLSCLQLDQKHCLFLLPSANKFVFRPLFTRLLLSPFLSKHFGLVFGRRQFSPPPPHSFRGTCNACRTRCLCMLHIMANMELMVINHLIVL